MNPDINSKADIHFIISKFYEQLLNDALMKPFFVSILEQGQLAHHIEIITNFWSDILFDTHVYTENVMQKHLRKNAEMSFQKIHFERWTSYFTTTIDANFDGQKAHLMKQRALSIGTVMQLKMHHQK